VRYFEATIGNFYGAYLTGGVLTIDFSGEDLNNDGKIQNLGSDHELLSFSAHFEGGSLFDSFDLDGVSNLVGLIYAGGPNLGQSYGGNQQGLLTIAPTNGYRVDGGTAAGAPCSGTFNACYGLVKYVDGQQVQFAQSNSLGVITELAAPTAAPEPASWALMLGGFGLIGAMLRSRRIGVRFAH
jgi:hypothetical protein